MEGKSNKRHQLDIFVAKFGELTLNELTVPMVMTEYYTRAAIPEMVEAMQGAIPAVNGLFE